MWYRLNTVVDPGEGPEGPAPPFPLFLDKTEAVRVEKKFFLRLPPPSFLRFWMTAPKRPPPPPRPLSEGLDPPMKQC